MSTPASQIGGDFFSDIPDAPRPRFDRTSPGGSFGARRPYGGHTGADFPWAEGEGVGLPRPGKVRFAGTTKGYGNRVEVDHDDGTRTTYSHLSKIGVAKGDDLDAGSFVGAVGHTGHSHGDHLHYEVLKGGRKINPLGTDYVPVRGAKDVIRRNDFFADVPEASDFFADLPDAATPTSQNPAVSQPVNAEVATQNNSSTAPQPPPTNRVAHESQHAAAPLIPSSVYTPSQTTGRRVVPLRRRESVSSRADTDVQLEAPQTAAPMIEGADVKPADPNLKPFDITEGKDPLAVAAIGANVLANPFPAYSAKTFEPVTVRLKAKDAQGRAPSLLAVQKDVPLPSVSEVNDALMDKLGPGWKALGQKFRAETGNEPIAQNLADLRPDYNAGYWEIKAHPSSDLIEPFKAYDEGGLQAYYAKVHELGATRLGEVGRFKNEQANQGYLSQVGQDITTGLAKAGQASAHYLENLKRIHEGEDPTVGNEDTRAIESARASMPEYKTLPGLLGGESVEALGGLARMMSIPGVGAPVQQYLENIDRGPEGALKAAAAVAAMEAAGLGGDKIARLTELSPAARQVLLRAMQAEVQSGIAAAEGAKGGELLKSALTGAAFPVGRGERVETDPIAPHIAPTERTARQSALDIDVAVPVNEGFQSPRVVKASQAETDASQVNPQSSPVSEGLGAQSEMPVEAVHHSNLQPRRQRNTATGTKGQFKKGAVQIPEEVDATNENTAARRLSAPNEGAALPSSNGREQVDVYNRGVGRTFEGADVQTEDRPSRTERGLSRNFRAGNNEATLTFASAEQRDLFDAGARLRAKPTGSVYDTRRTDAQNLLESVAKRLGVSVDEARELAYSVHDDVRAQMRGVKHLEERKVVDNVVRVSDSPAASVSAPVADHERLVSDFDRGLREKFKLPEHQARNVSIIADELDRGLTKYGYGRGELLRGVAAVESGAGKGEVLSQEAWHGSPHEFTRFDISKMGTGEGAQSYGAGHYFTDKREIAQHYKEMLSREIVVDGKLLLENNKIGRGTTGNEELDNNLIANAGDIDKSIADFERRAAQSPESRRSMWTDALDVARKLKERGAVKMKTAGRLYKVDLAPKDDEYLLWDKPLSEQSEKVKAAARQHFGQRGFNLGAAMKMRGSEFYEYAVSSQQRGEVTRQDARLGSEYLKSLGIRGIKYLDGSSRIDPEISRSSDGESWGVLYNSGPGTRSVREFATKKEAQAFRDELAAKQSHNYVIFDDADVSIKEVLRQQNKAATEFLKDGRAVIRALNDPNVSSGLHEFHHVFTPHFAKAILRVKDANLKETGEAFFKWLGFRSAKEFTELHNGYVQGTLTDSAKARYVEGQEKGSRGFERYMKTGEAPNVRLKQVFADFKEWLTNIYGAIKGKSHPLSGKLSPEAIKAWDTVLGETKGDFGQLIHHLHKAPDEGTPAFFENAQVKRALRLKPDASTSDVRAALTEAVGKPRSSHLSPEDVKAWADSKGIDGAARKALDFGVEKYRETIRKPTEYEQTGIRKRNVDPSTQSLAELSELKSSPVARIAHEVERRVNQSNSQNATDVLKALSTLAELKRTKQTVSDYLRQDSLFGDRELTQKQEQILSRLDANPRKVLDEMFPAEAQPTQDVLFQSGETGRSGKIRGMSDDRPGLVSGQKEGAANGPEQTSGRPPHEIDKQIRSGLSLADGEPFYVRVATSHPSDDFSIVGFGEPVARIEHEVETLRRGGNFEDEYGQELTPDEFIARIDKIIDLYDDGHALVDRQPIYDYALGKTDDIPYDVIKYPGVATFKVESLAQWRDEYLPRLKEMGYDLADGDTRVYALAGEEVPTYTAERGEAIVKPSKAVDITSLTSSKPTDAPTSAAHSSDVLYQSDHTQASRRQRAYKALLREKQPDLFDDVGRPKAPRKNSSAIEVAAATVRAFILSNPATPIKAAIGLTTKRAYEQASKPLAAAFDAMFSKMAGANRATAGLSIGAISEGLKRAGREGIPDAWRILKGEEPQVPGQHNFPGIKTRVHSFDAAINTVQRVYGAKAALFYTDAFYNEVAGQAKLQARREARTGKIPRGEIEQRARQLIDNPSPEIQRIAVDVATRNVYMNENLFSDITKAGKSFLRKNIPGGHLAGTLAVPIDRVPSNAAIDLIFSVPVVGHAKAALQYAKAIENLREATRQTDPKAAEDLRHAARLAQNSASTTASKATMSTLFLLTGAYLAAKGDVDDKRARIPGTRLWANLATLGLPGLLTAMGGEIYRRTHAEGDKQEGIIGATAGSVKESLKEVPVIRGAVNAVDTSRRRGAGAGFSEAAANLLIPQGVQAASSLTDDKKRKPDGLLQSLAARIPFVRRYVPEDEGKPETNPHRLFDPFNISEWHREANSGGGRSATSRPASSRTSTGRAAKPRPTPTPNNR